MSDQATAEHVRVAEEPAPPAEEVVDLYDAVGWSAYTADRESLLRGVAGSHLVLTARDDGGRLVGLARTLSDGATACYLQDLLVRPDGQRRGVGRALVVEVLRRYRDVRFVGLTTDAADVADGGASQAFYRAVGLVPHPELGLAAFVRPPGP